MNWKLKKAGRFPTHSLFLVFNSLFNSKYGYKGLAPNKLVIPNIYKLLDK